MGQRPKGRFAVNGMNRIIIMTPYPLQGLPIRIGEIINIYNFILTEAERPTRDEVGMRASWVNGGFYLNVAPLTYGILGARKVNRFPMLTALLRILSNFMILIRSLSLEVVLE